MKFLLDTNFFLIPGNFKVDIFSELGILGKLEVYTLDLVVGELEKLSEKRGEDSRSAKLGLKLLEHNNVKVMDSSGKITDLELESMAEKEGYIVCTQDKKLIVRLKKKSLKVVYLRQKKYLEMG